MIHFLTMGGLSSLRIRLLLQLVAPRNYSYKRETESQNKWKLDIYTFKQKDSIVFDQCVFLDEQLFLCLLHIVLNMGTLLEHCRCIQEFDEQRGKDITPLAEHNLAILLKQPQSCQSHHCRPLSLSLKGEKKNYSPGPVPKESGLPCNWSGLDQPILSQGGQRESNGVKAIILALKKTFEWVGSGSLSTSPGE